MCPCVHTSLLLSRQSRTGAGNIHVVPFVLGSFKGFYNLKFGKVFKFSQFLSEHCKLRYFSSSVLFCSLAVLDPRVGQTMDVLSPFIPVLCHSD